MRFVLAVALVSMGLFSPTEAQEPAILPAPPAEAIVAPAPQNSPPSPVAKQYVIKCEIFAQDAKEESKLLAAPHIVVTDGQEGHIATQAELPFVTGMRSSDSGEVKPLVTRMREGTTGTVTVQSLEDEKVHVDASFSVSHVARTDTLQGSTKGTPATQAPLLKTDAWRVVRTLELGESIEIRDTIQGETPGQLIAKLSVDRIGADEAAITPIGAAEPPATESAKPVHTVVYAVGDLLEENARNLPSEKLQHTDFVLVMDMILSEAAVEWNNDTSLRCHPKKRMLVISQTQEGHEEIANLLRDKRTHVADAKNLLLR
ncbi:hypothetical protein [Aeoliella sp.]|uniref:hypothetical protein n=1 Tax=Aeoliella sp. TaxID=2795800 RepID=UPI003CCB84E1